MPRLLSGKFLKKLSTASCMASRPDDTVNEEGKSLEQSYESKKASPSSLESMEGSISYGDILEAYDTVVEVYNGSPSLHRKEVRAIDEEILLPDAEAYNSSGQSLERLAEELEGNTLVVAFGFEGEDLPGYQELMETDANPEGNWWDNPEKLDTDYLLDRTTYEGAVDVTGFEERPMMQSEGLDRGLYLFRNS